MGLGWFRFALTLGFAGALLFIIACGGSGSDAPPEPTAVRVGVGPCPAPCMELSIPGGDCTDMWPAVHCTVSQGETFSLKIIGRVDDPTVVGGFATLVYMDGFTYTAQECAGGEILFQPTTIAVCGENASGGAGHGNVGLGSPFESWANTPDLVEMPNVTCDQPGTFDIVLTAAFSAPPSPKGGSKFKDVNGLDILLNTAGYERIINDPDPNAEGDATPLTVDVADILTVDCI